MEQPQLKCTVIFTMLYFYSVHVAQLVLGISTSSDVVKHKVAVFRFLGTNY